MNIFLERLKDELSYQGLTQKELGEKTEISVNTIRGWFSKDLVPDVFNAVKVATALNTTVEYLVTGKNNTTKELQDKLKQELIKTISNALNVPSDNLMAAERPTKYIKDKTPKR